LSKPPAFIQKHFRWASLCLALIAAFALPALAGTAELDSRGGLMASTWSVNQALFQKSAHGFQGCNGCHAKEDKGIQPAALAPHPDPRSPGYLKQAARKTFDYHYCAKCHSLAVQRYSQGKHAEKMQKQAKEPLKPGKFAAPTCAHCHNPHTVIPHQGRIQLGRVQVEVCGSCHPAQKDTYLENYHGQAAANLGYEKAALCSDCHGAHTVVSLKKPEAALKACRRCHPDAPPSFAQMVMHPSPPQEKVDQDLKAQRVAVIQALALIMAVIALVTVLGFYGHSFLWMLRELHEKIRRRE
jgi:ribosomal protein L31